MLHGVTVLMMKNQSELLRRLRPVSARLVRIPIVRPNTRAAQRRLRHHFGCPMPSDDWRGSGTPAPLRGDCDFWIGSMSGILALPSEHLRAAPRRLRRDDEILCAGEHDLSEHLRRSEAIATGKEQRRRTEVAARVSEHLRSSKAIATSTRGAAMMTVAKSEHLRLSEAIATTASLSRSWPGNRPNTCAAQR